MDTKYICEFCRKAVMGFTTLKCNCDYNFLCCISCLRIYKKFVEEETEYKIIKCHKCDTKLMFEYIKRVSEIAVAASSANNCKKEMNNLIGSIPTAK